MSFAQTVVLGALAGFTIYLGLPFGRLQLLSPRARVALAMFSVGVLAFLFVDVLEHGFGILESAVQDFKDDRTGIRPPLGLTALLGVGFATGTAGLATVERLLRRRTPSVPPGAGAGRAAPPGAAHDAGGPARRPGLERAARRGGAGVGAQRPLRGARERCARG